MNEAPALAQADVGIAIGVGTDVGIETADVVLMKSDPLDVVKAIDLSKATVAKMTQNLWWAAAYSTIAFPMAAGGILSSLWFDPAARDWRYRQERQLADRRDQCAAVETYKVG